MDNKMQYELLCEDLLPILRQFSATERYAIALGGSHAKGISDAHSDYDFRVYYDERTNPEKWTELRKELDVIIEKWKNAGVEIDGAWSRRFSDIESELDEWISGNGKQGQKKWSIWGYELLTDIYNQTIVEDPFGIATGGKKRLEIYPEAMKKSIIEKHGSKLIYWRSDYHYKSKVRRRDIVFLSSITNHLVHDILQIIYALNGFYYPGDGMNLKYTVDFEVKPDDFEGRISQILYPGIKTETPLSDDKKDIYKAQYEELMAMIDEVLELTE